MVLAIIFCILFGYLFGCFSTGFFIGKIKKVDIRQYGSKSAGTTNALRTLGAKAGALTLLGDMLKAILAIVLVRFLILPEIFPEIENIRLLSLYTGLGVVIGHNYPVWLKFKGGKGIAATAGSMVAFDPLIIPFGLPVFVISVAITKYVSVGSLMIATMFPLWVAIRNPGQVHMLLVALLYTLLAFIKHSSNIMRLIKGSENKLGQKVNIDNK